MGEDEWLHRNTDRGLVFMHFELVFFRASSYRQLLRRSFVQDA